MATGPGGKVYELEGVPDTDVEEVVKDFESEGATVVKEKQADGNWRVRAMFGVPEPKTKAWS